MGKLALGYGSEWHLLRYLARHRGRFTDAVRSCTGLQDISWLDFGVVPRVKDHVAFGDAEITGLDFLATDHRARANWITYWPQTGNVQNWDAVGVGSSSKGKEWLLVEAKANLKEIESRCQAKERGGRKLIEQRLSETKSAMGVGADFDWMQPYYQYANRLATLRFLLSQGVWAHLVFVYFTGDRAPRAQCPKNAQAWKSSIAQMKAHLGLTGKSEIEVRTHELILPVTPTA